MKDTNLEWFHLVNSRNRSKLKGICLKLSVVDGSKTGMGGGCVVIVTPKM